MNIARAICRAAAVFTLFVFAAPGVQAGGLEPPPGAVLSWGGIYVGIHGGYAAADLDWNTNDYPFGAAAQRPRAFDHSDAIGGGHFGVQMQRGPWVFGLEASLSGGFEEDAKTGANLFGGALVGDMSARVENLLLVTGRVGHAWGNKLAYLKAGYAGGRIALATDDNVPFPDFLTSTREWYSGWTAGAGLEFMVMPNIVLGVEYNYVNLSGSNTATIVGIDGSFIGTYRPQVDLDVHSVLARLSIKLDVAHGH